jgi:ubiquinone/menaquinone biosynthesis C-methylase UbiE
LTDTADALAERIFSSAIASFDIAGIYLGDRLGWYRSLADDGPATADELASRTATDARYAREWLEQQAVGGLLEVDDDHRFSLPAGYRDVLVDPHSLSLMAPLSRMIVAALGQLPQVAAAYRSGAGHGWDAYGADMREGQAAFNRPAVTHLLGNEWLPAVDDLHERLLADPPARVVDIGCGEGWSTLAIARAYPKARVTGIDLDTPSIEAARRHAAEAGLADEVEFRDGDAAELADPADLALIIEAVHDISNPVPVLRAVRESLAEGGSLIVVDERVAETFTAPGDDVERFMYGWSITTCLPDGRSRQPSVATGTVMRPDTLWRYAAEAGFESVEVLSIENDFFRFYRLRA